MNTIMDDNSRLQLQRMVQANNVEDQTDLIRNLKHSVVLKGEINTLLFLKSKYGEDAEKIHVEAMSECNFLFTYYTDIYNKVRKDEIDLKILFQFLDVLKRIEENELDQHEGSFLVGTLLKQLYIDSALKKAEKMDKLRETEEEEKPFVEPIKISWKQYKHINL
jgi:hypothetical protein